MEDRRRATEGAQLAHKNVAAVGLLCRNHRLLGAEGGQQVTKNFVQRSTHAAFHPG